MTSPAIVSVRDLRKTYKSGFTALKGVTLDIREGEILALLGPNGAGKTTLISTICGITRATSGSVTVGGHDILRDWRAARQMIGLVPQEVSLESFDTVINVVRFSRGLFGKRPDDAHVEKILKQLSLWDKRDSKVVALSGGMKRRVLIAKALSYEPRVLFLDEPTAGVDVDLRRDMWRVVGDLRASGVTIILTTHYIEEAEAIADRIAVILKGEIILTEDKAALMQRMGRKELTVRLADRLTGLPASLAPFNLTLGPQGDTLVYAYDTRGEKTGITTLLNAIRDAGLQLVDLDTQESSLEEIFLGLVRSGQ